MIINIHLTLSVVFFLIILSLPAMANDTAFWLGAGVGAARLEETTVNSNQKSNYDGLSTKLEAGYDVNRNFGGFISYDFTQETPDVHIGTIGVRGKGDITESLSLFTKAGVSRVLVGNSNNSNGNGLSGMFGLGGEYQFTPAFSMKMGIDYYHRLETTASTTGHVTQLYLGVGYRFGQTIPNIKVSKEVYPAAEKVEISQEVYPEVVKTPTLVVSGVKLFPYNSSNLKPTPILEDILSTLLADVELKLTLVGHTDHVGSHKYNLLLSERRAQATADYFIANGVNKDRINVEGRGKLEPIASNENESGRASNRRVELNIE